MGRIARQARGARVGPRCFKGTLIITGFIASDRRGVQTTLGRNGSDFSGSIFGSLLDAGEIHIWTDVDGVLSADPRRVPDAKVIDSLSYNEAMELAYFGAKVIHPQTMAPAVGRGIPIWIRNTFAPQKPGSLICAKPDSKLPVKGITSIENIAMVNVEGAGMIGVPGTAHRLFGALREEGISVILISQGSSEHSICCAIPGVEAERAARVVAAAFDREIKEGQIQSIQVDTDLAILAVVGDGMAGLPGVSGKVFNALGSAGVNVHAIAQGASERNISVVVDGKDATRALRAVHSGFYLSPHTISIGLIGPGAVGRALLEQLAAESERLRDEFKLDLRAARHHGQQEDAAGRAGHSPSKAGRRRWTRAPRPRTSRKFVEHLHVDHLPHTVIIDCTADESVAQALCRVARGRHPRGHAQQEGEQRPARATTSRSRKRAALGGSSYLYEATVGAGLPVIQTLRDLRETGDKITSVEGIFSGTLAYLFNVYDGKTPFSRDRQGRQGQGLHRAGSARRPVGHRLRAQGHHPRPRDGPEARDERRAGGEPDSGRAREGHHRRFPERPAEVRRRNEEAIRRRRPRAARCCATWAGSRPTARPRSVWPSSTSRMPSPTSRSPTTWCVTPPRATTPIR